MKNPIKLFKILQNTAISIILVMVALVIFSIAEIIPFTPVLGCFYGIILIVCFACLYALPWARKFEKNENKKLSLIFMSLIAVCAVLWMACLIVVIGCITSDKEPGMFLFNLIRISLVLSIQMLVSSTIASTILKYKNSMIPFQVITYLSHVYIDFFVTTIIVSINSKFDTNSIVPFLFTKWPLIILALSCAYVFISNIIIKKTDKRKMTEVAYASGDVNYNPNQVVGDGFGGVQETTTQLSPTVKLEKLKDMYEKELITKEEYEKKKEEILKEF